ncbi:MAG TPA: MXAN_2562 family outer membrane beta-barrel protein [Polyangiaceae bacterium]
MRSNHRFWKCAFALCFAVAALAFARPVHAQGIDDFGAYGGFENRGRERSPQEIAFEFRFGQYRPGVDDDLNGTPYLDTFGTFKRWHVGAEFDWQLLRIKKVLSFGPGVGFSYTRSSADAPLESGEGFSAQKTALNIFPFHLVGVLRFDMLADRTPVPIAPYLKLGAGYALWWSTIGEEVARFNGEVGRDESFGWVFAAGAVVRLDWLDPRDAAAADAAIGLNHSGLFIEWFKSDLSGFGATDNMQVGTSTWVAGLVLEI